MKINFLRQSIGFHVIRLSEKENIDSDKLEGQNRGYYNKKKRGNIMKNNVVLIGMPGSGKSTIGVVLAKLLCYQFVDMDIVIQEQEKKLLREIIEEKGNDGFMEIENRVNAEFEAEYTVIAPGGSVIYGKEAMEHLHNIGIVIYLKLDYQELESRLGDLKARGVVLKEGYTLKTLYEERTALYEKYADIVLEEGDSDLITTVNMIMDRLKEEQFL